MAARSVHLKLAVRQEPPPGLASTASPGSLTVNVASAGADCTGDRPAHTATKAMAAPTNNRILFISHSFVSLRLAIWRVLRMGLGGALDFAPGIVRAGLRPALTIPSVGSTAGSPARQIQMRRCRTDLRARSRAGRS